MRLDPIGLALAACRPELITLDTHVYEPLTGDDLEDVELCDWPEAETCVHTDASGDVSFEFRPSTDYHGTMRNQGFQSPRRSSQSPPAWSSR